MSIKEEIIQVVRNLDYKGEVEIAWAEFHRLFVLVDGVHIGIYDTDEQTFVDLRKDN